eukprot:10063619-Alexandrium_andersonii.AAC.1
MALATLAGRAGLPAREAPGLGQRQACPLGEGLLCSTGTGRAPGVRNRDMVSIGVSAVGGHAGLGGAGTLAGVGQDSPEDH